MQVEYEFGGRKYRVEGRKLFVDNVLQPMEIPNVASRLESIKALLVDNFIYFKDAWYKKI